MENIYQDDKYYGKTMLSVLFRYIIYEYRMVIVCYYDFTAYENVVDAAENGNATKIPLIIIGNIICGFISLVIYRGAAILYNVEAKRAYANLCKNVFAKEIKLPFSYYEKHHSGEFISKISYDLEKMGSIYSSRLRRAVAPILQVIVYLIPMFILNWQITICFICVNVCMLIINTFLIKPIRDVSKKYLTVIEI